MSHTLILMRHAKSGWDDITLPDHDRPLNARGRASAKAMGEWLRTQGYTPDTAISSSSQRTGETFHGLGFDVPVQFTRALYHAGPEMMMEVLRDQTAPTVLMLGHNPGWESAASCLAGRHVQMTTCNAALLEREPIPWAEAIQAGWHLRHHVRPKML